MAIGESLIHTIQYFFRIDANICFFHVIRAGSIVLSFNFKILPCCKIVKYEIENY